MASVRGGATAPEPEPSLSRAQIDAERFAIAHSDALLAGQRLDLLAEAQRVADAVTGTGADLPASAAWRMGLGRHLRGEYLLAQALYEAAGPQPAGGITDRAILLAAHASSLWAQGKADQANECADAALHLAKESGDDRALAHAWVAQALLNAHRGDRVANLRAYELALDHADRAGDTVIVVRVRSNLGSLHCEEGRYSLALEELDQLLTLAETEEAGIIGALANINRGEALYGLGRLDEALAEVHIARQKYRAAESPMLDFALLLEADITRLRGNSVRAESLYRETLASVEQSANAQLLATTLAGLSRTLISDDPAAASELSRRALSQPNALGDARALLSAGWVAHAVDDATFAQECASKAIAEAGRRHDLTALADGLELRAAIADTSGDDADVAALLDEAASAWQETGDVIRIAINRLLRARHAKDRGGEAAARSTLNGLGIRVDASRIAGPLHAAGQVTPPLVAIRTLGAFSVAINGEPLSTSAWPSRKSRALVKILASSRRRAISRAALSEILWPGVPDTSARLSVILSTTRTLFDPERRYPSDHFLVTTKDDVRLNLDTVGCDIAEFEELANAGLLARREGSPDALAILQAAAVRYPAPFLAEEVDSDWAAEARERLQWLSADVKRGIVELLHAQGESESAIGWLVALVSDDSYDEAAHLDLVRSLVRSRRHGEAARAYSAYERRMRELGVEPTPRYELLEQAS